MLHAVRERAIEHVGLRRVRRPVGATEFDLGYVRDSPGDGTPVVVLPGGPGLASVLPYRDVRRGSP